MLKTKYIKMVIFTSFFFSRLAMEGLQNHFIFKFLISSFGKNSPVKRRLLHNKLKKRNTKF